jgi:TctA family transporter
MDLLSNLAIGFQVALSVQNLFYCAVGVSLGTFVGVLPGIGPLATIAMLLPVTFYLPPVTALIMLAGVYYGAMYGGSITSILMNMPGDGASAVVVLDGNPMAKQGRAGPALVSTTFASFFGSCVALVVVGLFAPPLAAWALEFGPTEYFSLMVLGLLAAVMLTRESALKGIAMVLLGLLLGIVGIDVNSGEYRFTFGMQDLSDGINFVVLAMGLFAFGEIISNLAERKKGNSDTIKYTFRWRDLMLSRDDFRRSVLPVFRGTGVGALLGLLPGTGTTIASFVAYSVEKRVARDPSRFGHGAIEGIVAPEAANNAAANTSFIPTLTLGVPGDSVMALMLAALMIHGINPGPAVMTDQPQLFWGLLVSMVIGNLLLLILNLPMVGIWVRLLTIPYRMLYPPVILFICIGVYSLRNNVFDIYLTALIGGVGYLFIKLRCEPAPLLLGSILGPLMEENFRRSLIMSRGDPAIFLTRPISLAFLSVAALVVVLLAVSTFRGWKQRAKDNPARMLHERT